MENNFLISNSKNKGAKILFYIFEGCASFVGFVMFVLAIVWAAQGAGFGGFVQMFVEALFYTLVLFGFGKVIDLMSCKADNQNGARSQQEKATKVEKTEKKEKENKAEK